MATVSSRAATDTVEKIADDSTCAQALAWIDKNTAWVTEQQIALSEIPAPEFSEAKRAAYFQKILEPFGLKVSIDKTGNVIAERPGADPNGIILLAAHLDTVFPAGTEVRVKKNGNRLVGPGIADNGAGLAALIGVARAASEGHVRNNKTIIFAGDVGEEGEGNLSGIRALIDAYRPRLSAVIAVHRASTEHITTQGIASHRFEVTITGPGGHSWSDFGAPNPITALSRGIVKFSSLTVPEDPRSSYNFGVIEGGTSVNSIPARAVVKVDLRSEDEAEVTKMEAALRDAMQAGIKEEMAAARDLSTPLQLTLRSLGLRPSGKLP